MAVQLALELDPPDGDWHLDDHTREVGRRGVAAARQALARSARRQAAEQPARPAAA